MKLDRQRKWRPVILSIVLIDEFPGNDEKD